MKKYVGFVSLLPGMALAVCLLLAACRPAYEVTKVEGRLVAMDSTWDARPDSAAVALLLPYVNRVDSAMRHVLGQAAVSMEVGRPESLLSNLIADVLREAAAKTLGRPADMGLVNMGGLRSSLTRGDITLENVYEILPFENTLCVMTLKGRVLRQLFENIAVRRGEGVSGVKLVVSKDGRLLEASVDGQPVGNMSAREYFRRGNKQDLWGKALAAYQRLSGRYNPIVLEGAGSISELNLRDRDITNMRMAEAVGASTYLVADIERGGVFASVYGSVMLLPETQRKLLKGIIINKFRGDVSLFDEGRRMLEDLTGVPVVGVVPVLRDVHIPAEDSMALEHVDTRPEVGKVNVAVIRLPHVSNFTDFDALVFDGRFHVYYTDEPAGLSGADVIILPGTKNTIADLEHIRRNGVVDAVVEAYGKGKQVVGICGGYQMLGLRVEDPLHVEGRQEVAEGIGLLPLVTVLGTKKMVCQNAVSIHS